MNEFSAQLDRQPLEPRSVQRVNSASEPRPSFQDFYRELLNI